MFILEIEYFVGWTSGFSERCRRIKKVNKFKAFVIKNDQDGIVVKLYKPAFFSWGHGITSKSQFYKLFNDGVIGYMDLPFPMTRNEFIKYQCPEEKKEIGKRIQNIQDGNCSFSRYRNVKCLKVRKRN